MMMPRHANFLTLLGVMLTMTFAASGCARGDDAAPAAQVDVAIDPSPPTVGDAALSVTLTDAAGAPLSGATVKVEGNMNHAGMKPSFATLTEADPGTYTGTLRFTMAGDWFLLIDATLADARTTRHKVDVKGVQSR